MGLNKKAVKENIIKHYAVTIFLVTVITWFPVLFVSFINDDIQILSYFKVNGLNSIFQPFTNPDVMSHYWRPLGSILHIIIILIAGFHPFTFRLISLLLYSVCIILFVKVSEEIGIQKEIGVIFALIFIVLPSHELQVAWIADQSESFFTIFILLAFISYFNFCTKDEGKNKNFILWIVWFLCAVLVKESAYAGIFIPFIVIVSQNDYKKVRLFRTFRDFGIGILVVLFTLIYRYIFIGGTPFGSDHFSNFTFIKSAVNFFIYIPLAFIPPEALEWLQSISSHLIILIFLVVIFLSIIIFFIRRAFQLKKQNLKIFLTGILWYVVFVLPAIPKLMRWYVFAASIGLIWVLVSYAQNWKEFFSSKKILIVLSLLIAGTAVYDFNLMTRWVNAGNEFETALASAGKYKDEIFSNSLLIWVVPDKIDRIPIMKLGVQQSIQWEIKNDNVDVSSPFRVEMVNTKSRIKLISHSDSTIVFGIFNGRFLPLNGKSHYIIHNELLTGSIYGMDYKIKTVEKNKISQSILEVKFKSNQIPNDQMYFNGEKFLMMKKLL